MNQLVPERPKSIFFNRDTDNLSQCSDFVLEDSGTGTLVYFFVQLSKNTNRTNLELSDNSAQEETSNYSYLAPNDKKTVRFSYTEVIEEFFEDNDCVDTSIAYGCILTLFSQSL